MPRTTAQKRTPGKVNSFPDAAIRWEPFVITGQARLRAGEQATSVI